MAHRKLTFVPSVQSKGSKTFSLFIFKIVLFIHTHSVLYERVGHVPVNRTLDHHTSYLFSKDFCSKENQLF